MHRTQSCPSPLEKNEQSVSDTFLDVLVQVLLEGMNPALRLYNQLFVIILDFVKVNPFVFK